MLEQCVQPYALRSTFCTPHSLVSSTNSTQLSDDTVLGSTVSSYVRAAYFRRTQ
jgi:hypothetical protein